MANLTDNKEVVEKARRLVSHPVVAGGAFFKGSLCRISAAGLLGVALAEAGAKFAGISEFAVDNSAGAAGDICGSVLTEGVFLLEGAGFSQASVGSEVYASDDQTISTVQAADEQAVGIISNFVSATQVWVDIKV